MVNGTHKERMEVLKKGNRGNNDFFYNGNAGEYFLMASLSRRKLDAFKLPVDYGFDVLAISPDAAAASKDDPVLPYYFQVKTVYVRQDNTVNVTTKNGSRIVVQLPVKLKKDTLSLMMNDRNKAIVVYVYDTEHKYETMEMDDCPSFYFWISGEDLAEYRDILVREEEREEYMILHVNIVYPEKTNDPAKQADSKRTQTTYVTFGEDFLTEKEEGITIVNNAKDRKWVMFAKMKDEGWRHYRLSGFFGKPAEKEEKKEPDKKKEKKVKK